MFAFSPALTTASVARSKRYAFFLSVMLFAYSAAASRESSRVARPNRAFITSASAVISRVKNSFTPSRFSFIESRNAIASDFDVLTRTGMKSRQSCR